MTKDEIFAEIATHMINGLMVHAEYIDYYAFLGLEGYSKCHEAHYQEEWETYRKLTKYYLETCHKLPRIGEIKQAKVIPDKWYEHVQLDVSESDIKTAVKKGLESWSDWERSTLSFYTEKAKQLFEIGELTAMKKVLHLAKDVECELKEVDKWRLEKNAVGYDILNIIDDQK